MRALIAHLVGDYIVQTDYLALAKVQRTREGVTAAILHAVGYTACFLPLTRNPIRLAVIGVTHGLLDHYRPLPALIHRKDVLLSPASWPAGKPEEMPFWLHILVDNTVHLVINELALTVRNPR
ncbi:MAG TPA: DUF3307 domain-containing protein [Microlunatus sp.]